MRLDQGSQQVKSWGGVICSLILFLLVGGYTFQKLDVLLNKRDTDLLTTTNPNVLTMADEFDHSMGLNFAAAFTAYDAN